MESSAKSKMDTLASVQESWGSLVFCEPKANGVIVDYLYQMILDIDSYESAFKPYHASDMFRYCFQPSTAKGNPKQIAIYESRDKMDRGIRLIGKPARLIKRMIPFLSETECNAFAVWWNETFIAASEGLELIVSKDQSAFKDAYSTCDDRLTRNTGPNYSRNIKPLDCSCMRDSFSHLPIHPAESYASGDFTIVYVKAKELIAARCVVQTNKTPYRAGPIYTQSQVAADMIQSWLTDNNADFDSFYGAKMLREEYDSCYVLPYLDCGSGLSEYDSNYLIIDKGDIDSTSTSGLVSIRDLSYCEDCDESFDSDDMEYINNRCICPSCRNNNYFYCYESHEYVNNDDGVEVYYYGYNNRTRSDTYSLTWAENNAMYCESDGEYWKADCVVYVESESEYYPMHSDDIFQSDDDGEYYLFEEKVSIFNGESWTKDQAINAGYTLHNGIYMSEAYEVVTKEEMQTVEEFACERNYTVIKVDKIVYTSTVQLRLNYELNAYGDAVRLPDFFDLLGVE